MRNSITSSYLRSHVGERVPRTPCSTSRTHPPTAACFAFLDACAMLRDRVSRAIRLLTGSLQSRACGMLRHLSAHMSIARATEARNAQDAYHHEHGMTPSRRYIRPSPYSLVVNKSLIYSYGCTGLSVGGRIWAKRRARSVRRASRVHAPSTTQSGQRPFRGSSVDPHPTTLAYLPRGEDESSGALEQTFSLRGVTA